MAGKPIESSVFVGVEDFRGEGYDVVLDRMVRVRCDWCHGRRGLPSRP